MREKFIERSFKPATLQTIQQADDIITSYQRRGFVLTLRQLYYQFVARALIANKQTEYKRIGSILNDARLAGLLDWDGMEDRTRNVKRPSHWTSPQSIIDAVAAQYAEDTWLTQRYRPEIWIEKDALVGVIEPVCERMRVPYFACRGNVSQSEQYAAGKRFQQAIDEGFEPIVLHLGDHDPSGIDMTRDNADRLTMFAGVAVEVRRLALNMDQIERYNPPPNPAKESDSRFDGYVRQFGTYSSWELDALDPTVIDGLIQTELDGLIDIDAWDAAITEEDHNKQALVQVSDRWTDVVAWLNENEE